MRAISDMPSGNDVRFPNGMHRPDTLDLRIIKEIGTPRSMQWNVRESYASIAKRVGVDEETVRKRIKRQEKLGAIQGWRAVIHSNLIGCKGRGGSHVTMNYITPTGKQHLKGLLDD
jgi:DNA-binding Lrp family transcriptional regulator